MNKFLLAFKNELIKTSQRKLLYILTAIMFGVVFIVGGVLRLTMTINEIISDDYDSEISWYEEEIAAEEAELKELLNSAETDSSLIYYNISSLKWDRNGKKLAELKREYDISTNHQYDYRQELIENIALLSSFVDNVEYARSVGCPDEYLISFVEELPIDSGISTSVDEAKKLASDKLTKLVGILDNKDFAEYVNMKKAEIDSSDNLYYTEEQKLLDKQILDIRLESDLTGEYSSHDTAIKAISSLQKYKKSVETGYNLINSSFYTSEPEKLLPSEIEDYRKQILILEYKYESGYYTLNEGDNNDSMFTAESFASILYSVGTFFVLIIIVLFAGSIISNEISSGAVKALLVSPVKRFKVYAAKTLDIICIFVIEWLILAVAVLLSTGIFFGFRQFLPYIYVSGGQAHGIAFPIYILINTFLHLVPTIFFGTLAMMMSSLTRNTAASIVISLGTFYVTSSFSTIFVLFGGKFWLKYVPTISVDAIAGLMEQETESLTSILLGLDSVPKINPVFAICYVGILLIAMYLVGWDAFCRRDIK